MKHLLFILLVACGGSQRPPPPVNDPLAGLPAPAAAALRREAQGAAIAHVRHEVDEGIDFWRADWKDDDRAYHVVTVTKDGSVVAHDVSESRLKD